MDARGDAAPGESVFRIIPSVQRFHSDLATVGIKPEDERARKVVLHSLRHSLATMLAASKVPMAVAQRIMRHRDIRLTAETYTDEGLLPLADAMRSLPALMDLPERVALRATGTDCDKTVHKPRRPGSRKPLGQCTERSNGAVKTIH